MESNLSDKIKEMTPSKAFAPQLHVARRLSIVRATPYSSVSVSSLIGRLVCLFVCSSKPVKTGEGREVSIRTPMHARAVKTYPNNCLERLKVRHKEMKQWKK